MKVAIVHELMLKLGGAERVVRSLLKQYPDADVYTLVYDPEFVEREFKGTKFFGSGVQKLPGFLRRRYRYFFPYYRRAVEHWDLSQYDLVISSSSAFAHGVVTNLNTKHVCYYHSPTRYLWDWHFNYLKELGAKKGLKRLILQWLLGKQRVWDFMAAQRPEIVIGNSKFIAERIKKFYRRKAEVVYPPVEVDRFEVATEHQGYYLFVGSLTPYKNVELAIKFFNKIGHPFKVVGSGKDWARLQGMAKENIEIITDATDEDVASYMQGCKALVFPGEEDFGIVMVEAMASGKPVFAYGKGGALEIVKPGETGWLFAENSLSSFEKAFAEFLRNYENFKPKEIRKWAEQFSEQKFLEAMADVVKD